MDALRNIIITDITDVVTVSSPKGRFVKINNRKTYGLSFCEKGEITYNQNGTLYVSDCHHAIILPKNQSYKLYTNKSGEFPVINFECADFLCDTLITLPVENIDSVMRDFYQIKNLFPFENNRAKIMSLFYNIIHSLTPSNISANNILLPAVKYIEENYSSPALSNTYLANECKISEIYFRKLFKKQFGTTPRKYIIDIRINKAKQLLSDGILKINAISEKCGFSNQYHFCRLFKEKTGMTPTEYMKKNK